MKNRSKIPIDSLPPDNGGFEIKRFINVDSNRIHKKELHRDDHYLFYFQEKGKSMMMIDFEEVSLHATDFVCVMPGQMHFGSSAENSHAWAVSIAPHLVQPLFVSVLTGFSVAGKVIQLNDFEVWALVTNLNLLQEEKKQRTTLPFSDQIEKGLLDSCIGLFASVCHRLLPHGQIQSRQNMLFQKFKILLLNNFKTLKRPTEYASLLAISPSYLNECSNYVTGFPVSHWINQQLVTEAKRILYYTDDTVKEVAYALGYDDDAYFSRFFKKSTGMSPLAFRKNSRG